MLKIEQLEKLRKAGRVSANAREKGIAMVREGAKLLDIAEEVESYIKSQGCKLAFPCNISINEIAAHYTPSINDKTVFEHGDVVKIDCGAHLDGYVGDTAGTVEVGTKRYTELINASKTARDTVMEFIGETCPINEIGRVVDMTIRSKGYAPIKNLSGHQIKQYNLHAGLSIPNYDDGSTELLQRGMIIACEPFATDGEGLIVSGRPGNICRIIRDRPIADLELQEFFNYIKEEFSSFPFCARSCDDPKATQKVNNLVRHGYLSSYATLIEKKKGCVTQFEHTVYIGGRRGEITTLSDSSC
ncbi:MAG: type II methionyl aminopeptidase [archaeon]|nr:type II methionyl aminopeptidase [archaeon]